MPVWCVLPAGGRGTRMDTDRPKQFIEVNGKSLLMHTLETMASHPAVAGVVVALPQDFAGSLPATLSGKPVVLCVGGSTRADSVISALAALPHEFAETSLVLVHDAARPNVQHEDIDAVLAAAQASPDGALLAIPVSDTLKRADAHGRVQCTEPRERFWRAATPQCFARGVLQHALQAARIEGVEITDESMAMEQAGFHPVLVQGRNDNVKITTVADLDWFRAELARRELKS